MLGVMQIGIRVSVLLGTIIRVSRSLNVDHQSNSRVLSLLPIQNREINLHQGA